MSKRKTERLLGLVVCLLSTRRYLTADQIRQAVPGYPEQDDLFKRMFERDKEDLREMLRDYLTASGYEVIEAVDGVEAVALARSERPDLILMDIQLPTLDGYEATRLIKADPEIRPTQIVAISSFAMKGDEEKARASGCDAYVTKPYSPVKLLAMIRSILGEDTTR